MIHVCTALLSGFYSSEKIQKYPCLIFLDIFCYPWLLYLLPVSGIVQTVIYKSIGTNVSGGFDQVLEEAPRPEPVFNEKGGMSFLQKEFFYK